MAPAPAKITINGVVYLAPHRTERDCGDVTHWAVVDATELEFGMSYQVTWKQRDPKYVKPGAKKVVLVTPQEFMIAIGEWAPHRVVPLTPATELLCRRESGGALPGMPPLPEELEGMPPRPEFPPAKLPPGDEQSPYQLHKRMMLEYPDRFARKTGKALREVYENPGLYGEYAIWASSQLIHPSLPDAHKIEVAIDMLSSVKGPIPPQQRSEIQLLLVKNV